MPTTRQFLALSEKAEYLQLKRFCDLGSTIITLNSLQQNWTATAAKQITISKFFLHAIWHYHIGLKAGISEK